MTSECFLRFFSANLQIRALIFSKSGYSEQYGESPEQNLLMARDDARFIARVAPARVDLTRNEPSAPDEFEADSSPIDLEAEEEPKFLRAQKRVPVRRGALPNTAASRLKVA